MSRAARDAPDEPDNAATTLGEAARSLQAYGVEGRWTDSYQEALAAPWSICLIDGRALAPAQYPASWFGDDGPGGNHFVLWLPFWQGSADWFDDPLAYFNGQRDCRYSLESVRAAFAGAYLLPSTGHGEAPPETLVVAQRCALKALPNHTCIALAMLAAGARVRALDGGTGEWRQVRTGEGMSGWVPREKMRAA